MTENTEQLHFRIDSDTKDKLTTKAKLNGLTLTTYVRHLLTLEANKCTN